MGLHQYQERILNNFVSKDFWDGSKLVELMIPKPLCSFEIYKKKIHENMNEFFIYENFYLTKAIVAYNINISYLEFIQ